MKVMYLTKYDKSGASSRMRFYQFFDMLEANGIKCDVYPLLDKNYIDYLYKGKNLSRFYLINRFIKRIKDLTKVFNYDLIWIQAEIFPYIPPIFEYALKKIGVKIFVEFDDAIFHNYDRFKIYNKIFGNKIDYIMKLADHVIAGNDYLKNRAKSTGQKNITVIPTVIDFDKYKCNIVKEPISERKTVVGWIGTPNTQKSLELIRELDLDEHCINNVKFLLIGCSRSPFSNIESEIVTWTADSEVENLNKIDIGIMPLVDTPFERGKCGYKLIQYMACQKPILASPVGVNTNIVHKGKNGFLCNSIEEWSSMINYLHFNKSKQITMGNASYEILVNNYTKDIVLDQLLKLINKSIKASIKKV